MRRRLYKFQFTICCSVLAHAHTLSQCRVTFLTHEQTQPTRKQTLLPCTAQLSFAVFTQIFSKIFGFYGAVVLWLHMWSRAAYIDGYFCFTLDCYVNYRLFSLQGF